MLYYLVEFIGVFSFGITATFINKSLLYVAQFGILIYIYIYNEVIY